MPHAAHKGLNPCPLRHRLPNMSLRQVCFLIGSAPFRLSNLFLWQALLVLKRGGGQLTGNCETRVLRCQTRKEKKRKRKSNRAIPFVRQQWGGRVTAAGGLE